MRKMNDGSKVNLAKAKNSINALKRREIIAHAHNEQRFKGQPCKI